VAQEIFREVFVQALYPEALSAIARHRAAGRSVYLVSATVDAVAGPFAAEVGAAGCIATTLEVADGVFTGNVLGEVCYGGAKREAIRRIAERDGIALPRSHAYGDSYEDRHMLEAVGNPVAVNPDKKLRPLALEKGWAIARWQPRRG